MSEKEIAGPQARSGTTHVLRARVWSQSSGWRLIDAPLSEQMARELGALAERRLQRDPRVAHILSMWLGSEVQDVRRIEVVEKAQPP